jgi:hypothetical protein
MDVIDRLRQTTRGDRVDAEHALDDRGPEHRGERSLKASEILQRLEKEQKKISFRRKLGGGALSALGLTTLLGSCALNVLSMVSGAATIAGIASLIAGLGFLVVGGALLFRRAQMKPTNQALVIALKHNNMLTVARLALEMDVSVAKAENIIQELVKRSIAEIDLDHHGDDDSLVYRIKGV